MRSLSLILILVLTPSAPSFAGSLPTDLPISPKPLFELGLAGGAGLRPDYPASDQSRVRFLVLPFAIYRGERWRADEDGGLNARVVTQSAFGLDVSASGSFPASSSENTAREGMPDLDWLGEFGPRLYYRRTLQSGLEVRLALPARAVFSTDLSSIEPRGWAFAPSFRVRKPVRLDSFPNITFHLTLIGTVDFATEKLHSYFYTVPPEFVRSDRARFEAQGGFLGTKLTSVVDFEIKSWRLFLAASAQSYSNSASSQSPLFRKTSDATASFGMVWTLFESETPGHE